jgi:hypothetical protein
MIDQLSAAYIRPVLFLQIQFSSGQGYVWSGIGTINWNGQQWIGVGTLGTISAIEESSEISAVDVTFSLAGIDNDLIAKALGEVRQGYPAKLWVGCLGDNDNVLIDPLQIYAGRVDVPTIEEGAATSTVSITVENRLIDLNRSRERRYTNQDQQIDHPGDLGFALIQFIQNWNGTWGKAGPGGVPPTSGAGNSSGPKGGGRGGVGLSGPGGFGANRGL